MTNEQKGEKITDALYKKYGSDTGYLFGIEPKYRDGVQVIVRFTLDYNKGEKDE